MKNLLLNLCLIFTFSCSFTQPILERILSNEIQLAISDGVRLDDENWIFSAFAYSVTPGDSAMAIVFKTDSTFKPLWAKRYKYLRRDDFSCITPLSDGNVLIGGTMRQDFSSNDGGSVFKLDTAGNVIWHLMYDEDFDDRVLDIFEQSDSTLMVFIREGVNNRPTKIVHADKDGSILSQRSYTFDNTFGLLANEVVTDESKQYYFSGSVFYQGVSEVFVCAVDDSSLLWYKRYNFSDLSVGNFSSAYVDNGNSIVLAGSIDDTNTIFVNTWLMKIDLQGNVVWAKEYSQPSGYTESISDIKPLSNGDLMVFGRVFDDNGSKGFAMKVDSMGNQIWTRGYNPSSPTLGIGSSFILPDGRMLINANSGEEVFLILASENGENACSISEVDLNVTDLSVADSTYALTSDNPGIEVFIPPLTISDISINDSLLCEGSVGIPKLLANRLEIYPNPAQTQLTIDLPVGIVNKVDLSVIDTWGRKIAPIMTRNEHKIQLNVSQIPGGMYWIHLRTDGELFSGKFIKQ